MRVRSSQGEQSVRSVRWVGSLGRAATALAAALVVGDDAVLEVGLGTADEQGNPVAPTPPFLIASLAKSVPTSPSWRPVVTA